MTTVRFKGGREYDYETLDKAKSVISKNKRIVRKEHISIEDMRAEFIASEDWFPSDVYIRNWYVGIIVN